MSDSTLSLAELTRLWAIVASSSDESGEAAALLGCGLREALRTDGATPRPGSAAVLEVLFGLLSTCSGSGEVGDVATEATGRVVEAIGWELFDALVVHLPVSLSVLQPTSHSLH